MFLTKPNIKIDLNIYIIINYLKQHSYNTIMNNQDNNRCVQQTLKGHRCKNNATLGAFCHIHTDLKAVKCYYGSGQDNKRCNELCKKGNIYCKNHIKNLDGEVFFEWSKGTFEDCETSSKYYDDMKPYLNDVVEVGTGGKCYTMTYPIKVRHRDASFTDDEKIVRIDAEIKEVETLFNEYVEFVKDKYKTEYLNEGVRLTEIYNNLIHQLEFEKSIKRIEFTALSMDGTRERFYICVYLPRAINNIKEHIIKTKYNDQTHLYNVSLFRMGQEEQIKEWSDELNGSELYLMVSAETARPYRTTAKSFNVGDLVKYRSSYYYNGANSITLKYGIIRTIKGDYMGIDNRKETIDKKNNKIKVDWVNEWGGIGATYGQGITILDIERWSNDPIFTNSNVFVDME